MCVPFWWRNLCYVEIIIPKRNHRTGSGLIVRQSGSDLSAIQQMRRNMKTVRTSRATSKCHGNLLVARKDKVNSNDQFAVNNSWIILVRAGDAKSRLHPNGFITDRIYRPDFMRDSSSVVRKRSSNLILQIARSGCFWSIEEIIRFDLLRGKRKNGIYRLLDNVSDRDATNLNFRSLYTLVCWKRNASSASFQFFLRIRRDKWIVFFFVCL